MALDRDELAARATAARAALLALCDALRPEAVAPAPSRPEWVRITGPDNAVKVTVGKVYHVKDYSMGGAPIITNDEGAMWYLPGPGETITATYPRWEPCAATAPAATPAPYVPRVGDVVRDKDHSEYAEILVVSVGDGAFDGRVISHNGPSWRCTRPSAAYAFVRPATPAECAAAGLPVEESAVDRVALAKVILDCGVLLNETGSFHVADAVLAFMAKAPAFDRAEFDEAQEREAAVAAYRAGTDGCIDPEGTKYPACRDSFRNGWIARARVAAKGGVA